MAAVVDSVEVSRRPEEVFAYLDDLSRHGEWQENVSSIEVDGGRSTEVGSRATETRRLGGFEHRVTYEITERTPPSGFAFQGVGGLVRPFGRRTIEPLEGGSRSRITLELDFCGYGVGKLLVPFVRHWARKHAPVNNRRLRDRLESGAAIGGFHQKA